MTAENLLCVGDSDAPCGVQGMYPARSGAPSFLTPNGKYPIIHMPYSLSQVIGASSVSPSPARKTSACA